MAHKFPSWKEVVIWANINVGVKGKELKIYFAPLGETILLLQNEIRQRNIFGLRLQVFLTLSRPPTPLTISRAIFDKGLAALIYGPKL